eukprot:scaffold4592_cov56-Attheya_sp.AAC.4
MVLWDVSWFALVLCHVAFFLNDGYGYGYGGGVSGMTIEPLDKIHVDELSLQDFDAIYLDQRPVILVGATACPNQLNFETIPHVCHKGSSVTGNYLRTMQA